MYFVKKFGKVKAYQLTISKNIEEWKCNERCRSFRIRNVGNDKCFIISNGNKEPMQPLDSLTYGGYNDSYRLDSLGIEFEGIGTNPKIEIIEDIQELEPVLIQTEKLDYTCE